MEEMENRIQQLEMQIAMLMAVDESILKTMEERNVKRSNRKTERDNESGSFIMPNH